jgi:hypothetical protein
LSFLSPLITSVQTHSAATTWLPMPLCDL